MEPFLCHVFAFLSEVVHGLTSCTESDVTEGLCIFSMRLLGEFLDNLSFIFSFPLYCGEYIQCQRQNRSMDMITLNISQGCPIENEVAKGMGEWRGEAGLS